jgi:hypothetical protein
MESNSENKIILDLDVVKFLKTRIYLMERENHKTKKFKDNEIAEKIRRLIETEVDKLDN